MTVQEYVKHPIVNKNQLSLAVFGNTRLISDKNNEIRGQKWSEEDFEKVEKYLNSIGVALGSKLPFSAFFQPGH